MASIRYSIIFYFQFILCICAVPHRFNPGGEPFQFIGIFSNCNNSVKSSIATYQQNVNVCKKSMDWVMEKKDFIANNIELYHRLYNSSYFKHPRKWTIDNVEYLTYYVCTPEESVSLAVEILLNRKYFIRLTERVPMWRDIYVLNGERTSKILAMVLYTEAETTKLILNILQLSMFPIYHLDPNWKIPVYLNKEASGKKKIFERETKWSNYAKRMEAILRQKKIFEFFIVELLSPPSNIYKAFRKLLTKTKKYCYSIEILNVSDQSELNLFLKRFSKQNSPKHIFVFGDGNSQVQLFNEAIQLGIVNKTWILQNIETIYFKIVRIPKTTNVLALIDMINQDLYFLEMLKPKHVIGEYISKKLHHCLKDFTFYETVVACSRVMRRLFIALIKGFDRTPQVDVNLVEFMQRYNLRNFRIYGSKALQLLTKTNNKIRKLLPMKFMNGLENIECKRPMCYKGWRNVYGAITNLKNSQNWNQTIGWHCQKCPEQHFKDFIGDGKCVKCPNLMKSTFNRDQCFDPYHTILFMEHLNAKFCISICVLGVILAGITIFTFIYYRETPFVRASNFQMAIFHLILIGTCFVLYPVIFFVEPTKNICATRPFLSCFINCPLIAVVFIKSNHILTIIQSQIRVSHGQMNKLKTLHFFVVFLFSGLGCIIAIVSLLKFPLDVHLSIDHINLTKELSCSSGLHVNLQIYYLLVLQLLPAVQAFRGRNLPGPYNEAMLIVYATFTTIISYLAMIPIYHFQPIKSDKGIVQCCVIVVMNLVDLLLLYSKRTYNILFHRDQNTKNYVRSQVQDTFLAGQCST